MDLDYLTFPFFRESRSKIARILEENKGSLPLEKLEALIEKKLGYPLKGEVLKPDEVEFNRDLKEEELFRYSDGIVYLD